MTAENLHVTFLSSPTVTTRATYIIFVVLSPPFPFIDTPARLAIASGLAQLLQAHGSPPSSVSTLTGNRVFWTAYTGLLIIYYSFVFYSLIPSACFEEGPSQGDSFKLCWSLKLGKALGVFFFVCLFVCFFCVVRLLLRGCEQMSVCCW